MNKKTKIRVVIALIFLAIYGVIFTIIHLIFKNLDLSILSGITAALTVILSPRIKNHQNQMGNKIQVTWIFMKKPLFKNQINLNEQ